MALLGCSLIGIADPRNLDRKNLIVWVEIDRCLTDAISAVTGVRLGKRTLKFIDYGKVAATFLHLQTGLAARLVALDSSRQLADALYPAYKNKKDRQMQTYLNASDKDLFKVEWVDMRLTDFDLPGHSRRRVFCSKCGEGINDGREVLKCGATLCKACFMEPYYRRHANTVDSAGEGGGVC
jgi:formylmethanofuran dehydrogenase subunit E